MHHFLKICHLLIYVIISFKRKKYDNFYLKESDKYILIIRNYGKEQSIDTCRIYHGWQWPLGKSQGFATYKRP